MSASPVCSEMSKNLEQAAFEKWLHDTCPSGDIESVHRQWLESYAHSELLYEAAPAIDEIERLTKELAAEREKIHSCHPGCTRAGCAAERLRKERDELFEAMQHPSYEEENRLRAEIERLRTGDTCARMCEGTAYRIEARANKADAERYRLLRRGQHWSVIDGIGGTLRADALDAAIDAALGVTLKRGGELPAL